MCKQAQLLITYAVTASVPNPCKTATAKMLFCTYLIRWKACAANCSFSHEVLFYFIDSRTLCNNKPSVHRHQHVCPMVLIPAHDRQAVCKHTVVTEPLCLCQTGECRGIPSCHSSPIVLIPVCFRHQASPLSIATSLLSPFTSCDSSLASYLAPVSPKLSSHEKLPTICS